MRAAHFLPTYQLYASMSPPLNLQWTHQEGQIALALQAYQGGHFTSKRAAANAYDIPESTFRSRVNSTPARRDSRPVNCKLSDTEELTLIQ